jgi:hypothetical protein
VIIFDANDPLVLNGTYDQEGYKPGERARIAKARARQAQPQPKRKDRLMFGPDTPLQLKGIYPRLETVDGETRKRVALEFFVQPFRQEMAKDLDVAGNLFTRTDGEPIDDILKIELAIHVPLQRMTLRSTSDSAASMFVDNVRVDDVIKVRRDKEGPVLAATLGVDFPYPTPQDLLYLFKAYTNQLFATFEPMQGDMLTQAEETEQEAPRRRRRKEKPAEETPEAEPVTS